MPSKMTPTRRSIALLKERGYVTAIVERWNPWVKIRQDLFGFGDVLALGEGVVLIVQTTSGSNLSKRVDKIKAHDNYAAVRNSGMKIVVHGWRKLKDGWACREVNL
jgi:hypothetical protein